ncbi:MAG TPA: hypothetical protein VF066_03880 [Thermoleophilaceae bacterium]
MQPKLSLAWMDSRQSYHDKLFGLADKSLRSAATPLIQDRADDFASHLRADGRNLVVWPEDLGLWASFTGRRGAEARASGSLVGAVASLFTSYAPQMSYYGGVYPSVASRFPPVRLLALALTDTFGRTAIETFSEMAAKHHVWLEAGVNMTQSWHVVCRTDEHPPQEPCDEPNPAKVQMLGDPEEPDRGYVYEAKSPDVSNMALVFGPDGKLVSKQIKTYITPSEVGQDEGVVAALDLVPGSIQAPQALAPVQTPVGRLGFVTSKDAWMPDVVDRLEEFGVDLLVQPEFFVGDLATTTGMWSADTLKASGYSDVQRHPGFSAMVLPSAVGSVFDFSADQQSHIAERLSKPTAGKWLIGQPPGPGLTAVTPWVVPDPIRPGEPIPERRKRLGEAGRKLAPGSGVQCPDPAKPAPCELGHVEGVLWKDVPVGFPDTHRAARPKRARFGAGRRLSIDRRPEQNPSVAMAGRYAVVVFEHRYRPVGAPRMMISVSRDSGRHWSRAKEPFTVREAPGDQRWPSAAVDRRGRVTLVWGKKSRIYYAQGRISKRGAIRFGGERPLHPGAPGAPQWKPAAALGPGGVVHVVFVDAREKFAKGGLPQAGLFYTRIKNGEPEPATRLDEGKAAPLATKMDNAWAPAIAVSRKRVLVSWIDFQNYDWDVMSRLSENGGSTFGKQVDLNPEKPDIENLSDTPKPLFTKAGPFVAWTDFHKRDTVDRVHPLYDTYIAPLGRAPVRADPYGGKQVSTFWPSVCAAGRDAIVAFQDSATGVARVKITRMRGGTRRGHAFSLSDGPSGAYRPSVACSGGRFVAAWEDMRAGPPRVYAAASALRRVR